MTQHKDLFAALAAPFEPEEVKLRTQAGRQLHYITARTAMNRLDDVLGPENWWDDYPVVGEHSVFCRLSVRLPDGQILVKSDAGGMAGMADPGDDDKSGFADAFKRAAVKFGVGRYLYRDGIPRFARDALKGGGQAAPEPPPARDGNGNGNGHHARAGSDDPRTGAALFAWLKKQEEELGIAIIKPLNAWGKREGLPFKMTEWDRTRVPEAVAVARKIAAEALAARRAIPARHNEPITQDEANMPDDQWDGDRE